MEESLSVDDKKELLKLARSVIDNFLLNKELPEFSQSFKKYSKKQGVFVTLQKNGNLRGCIGNILPEKEIYEAIIDNSINSAFHDPRFQALSIDELDEIEIEISILSIPQKLEYTDTSELKSKITPFEDGVILSFGMRKSTFLPQVWEDLPDFETFMENLSMKAGFEADAWTKYSPEVETYKADHFKESDLL